MLRNLADTITTQQARAIVVLAAGRTITDAAKSAHCARNTVHAWLGQEAFASALTQAKRDEIENTRAQVQQLMPLAINTVHSILKSKRTQDSVRLRAALSVLVGAEVMAEVDRRMNVSDAPITTNANSAVELLSGRIASLAARGATQAITLDVNGVAG